MRNFDRPIVYIDARMVGPVPHGIARYVTRLASGLKRMDRESALPYEPVFLVTESFPATDFQEWRIKRVRAGFLSLKELVEIPRAIRDGKLYHSPSFSSLFSSGPFRPRCPWVVTIHDLNHLSFGSRFQKLYYQTILKPFALRASQVITVSRFSRQEIAAWLGIAAEKIEIVYNALDPSELQPPSDQVCAKTLSRFGLERGKYFLCLSNPKPHKNIPFLVEAYQRSRASWPLVLTMNEHGDVPGVRAVGGLSDEDVRVLRACAGAMVFPSLYEGFGLPPIEAISLGIPLIASRISPHEEGLADAVPGEVRWIDPKDHRSLEDAFIAASQGKPPRSSESTRQKTLARFSETEMATRMDRIYRRVLEIPS